MTHVSRKRPKGENSEEEVEVVKKKKLNVEPTSAMDTDQETDKSEKTRVSELVYTAKLFTLELMIPTSWLSALERFHETYLQCEEAEASEKSAQPYDIVLEYCRLASEGFTEILQHINVQCKRNELALCFQVLCDIMQRTASKPQLSAYISVAERVARIVLTRHVQGLWFLMGNDRGKSKSYQIKVAVRFLSACASLSDDLARFCWERMGSFAERVFQSLLHRTDLSDAEDVRMCCIQLLLSFLLSDDAEFLNKVLGQVAIFTNIFARLQTDKFATLVLVLSTLIERVVRNSLVTPVVRKRFFTIGKPPRTEQIAALADWRGPQRSEFWNLHDRRKAHQDATSQNEIQVETDDRVKIVHDLARTLLDELKVETQAKVPAGAKPSQGEPAAAALTSSIAADLSIEAVAEALLESDKKRERFVKHVHSALQSGSFAKEKHASSFGKHVSRLFSTGLVFRSPQLCSLLDSLSDVASELSTCIAEAVSEHITARNAQWVTALLTRGGVQRSTVHSLVRLVRKARKHAPVDSTSRVENDRRDGALYLCAYGASLSELDCALFELLGDILADGHVREALRPYFWGATAVDHFRIVRDRANAELKAPKSASLNSLILAIDSARLLRTCVRFPVQLALNDFSTTSTANMGDLYDPRFLLSAFGDLLDSSQPCAALNDFVERHCLSLAVAALSSHDEAMRKLGSVILARFAELAKRREATNAPEPSKTTRQPIPDRVGRNAALISWREEVRFLVDLVRCALVGAANERQCDQWAVARVPVLFTNFFVRAIELIVTEPENELYRRLYEQLLEERGGTSWRRLLSNTNPSLFLSTFLCECITGISTEIGTHAKAARGWALQLLATGMRDTDDYLTVLSHAGERHNQLLSVLLTTMTCSIVDDRSRSLATDALLRVIDTCPATDHFVLRSMLLHLLAAINGPIAPRLHECFILVCASLWNHFSAQQRSLHLSHFRRLTRLLAATASETTCNNELSRLTSELQLMETETV